MINDADSDTTIDQPSNQKWSLKDKTLHVAKALAKERMARISTLHSKIPNSKQLSPACHPHFQMASSDTEWTWSNTTKFKQLYFYHAWKAGADYLIKVAHHNGLEFAQDEWNEVKEPRTHEIPTFHVTHLREPVRLSPEQENAIDGLNVRIFLQISFTLFYCVYIRLIDRSVISSVSLERLIFSFIFLNLSFILYMV